MNTQIIPKHKELKVGNTIYLDYTMKKSHKEFCGKKLTVTGIEPKGRIRCESNGKAVILYDDKTDGFFTVSA